MRYTTNTKLLTGVLSLSLLTLLAAPADSEAASLNLSRKKLTLRPGKSYTLKIRGSKSKKVKWKSTNKKVATVSKCGKVTARKTGKVKVTAKIKNKKTETGAYSVLNSLRSTYPEGMPLNNSYYYYSPRFGNGYGCYGFAAKLSDTVFGTEKSYQTHSSFDRIRVGDNIRIGNNHSVVVLTKSSSYITVVEGNYNSSVHWDRKITASSLASNGFRVYTRY